MKSLPGESLYKNNHRAKARESNCKSKRLTGSSGRARKLHDESDSPCRVLLMRDVPEVSEHEDVHAALEKAIKVHPADPRLFPADRQFKFRCPPRPDPADRVGSEKLETCWRRPAQWISESEAPLDAPSSRDCFVGLSWSFLRLSTP